MFCMGLTLRRSSLLLLLGGLLSCGSDSPTPPDGDEIEQVTVSPPAAQVDIGESTAFSAVVTNRRGDVVSSEVSVTWSTVSSSVATVDASSGLVTGAGVGTTEVRATVQGVSGSATVTVVDPNPPEAPAGVEAVPFSNTAVDVGWDDTSDNEDEFLIDREEVVETTAGGSGAGPAAVFTTVGTVGANVTTFRDEGLEPEKTYRYVVRACNENGCTPEEGSQEEDEASSDPTTTHPTLVLETEALPEAVVDLEYDAVLEASGGTGSFSWQVVDGALPAGLDLDESGAVAGTPTEDGEFEATVEVASGGQQVSRAFVVTVLEEILPPRILTEELAPAVVGQAYDESLAADRGDGDFAWAVTAGDLPEGVTLSAEGVVEGTPTSAGTATFTVQVTSAGLSAEKELSLEVFEALEVGTTDLPSGVEGVAYEAQLVASGGDGEHTWSVAEGALPEGLTLDPDGSIHGTPLPTEAPPAGPAAVGISEFTVQVESGDGQSAAAELSLAVWAPLVVVTDALPQGQVGAAYEAALEAEGGDGTYTWSVHEGTLPGGLTLDGGTGVISGTPAAPASEDLVLRASSGDGQTADVALTLSITEGPPSIVTTSLPDGELDVAYTADLEAEGGDGAFAWSLVEGSLPDGLTLDGGGTISGTPSAIGMFTFTVGVSSAGQADEQELEIEVVAAPVQLVSRYLIGGSVGEGYADEVEAEGGDGSVDWSVVAGALPGGITLNPTTGALTGAPSGAGVFYFTVRAESAGTSDEHTFAVAISSRPSSAFNIWVMNVSSSNAIPTAALIGSMSDALDRWEEVITGDLQDWAYGPADWAAGACGGNGAAMNGASIDDMVVMLNLAPIDGPSGTLGSAGPCDGRIVASNLNTIVGRLTLDTDDLGNLDAGQRFGLVWHEIGHIVGIGTWWHILDQVGGTNLVSDVGGADPRYEGLAGNDVYVNEMGAGSSGMETKIPVEADGGSGTRDGHWDEGEFDHEMMTGWSEASGVAQPISKMTISALADLAYTVDVGAADGFTLPGCSPGCTPAPPLQQPEEGRQLDDILDEPVTLRLPDGRVLRVPTLVPRR